MSFFAAFLIALLVSVIFAITHRGKKTSMTLIIVFFLVLFMAGMAAQLWVIPFGPSYWGISWTPLIFITFIFSLLIAAPSPYYRSISQSSKKEEESESAAAVSLFVWILLVFLVIAVVAGWFKSSMV